MQPHWPTLPTIVRSQASCLLARVLPNSSPRVPVVLGLKESSRRAWKPCWLGEHMCGSERKE